MRSTDRAIDILRGAARNQRPRLSAKRIVAFEVIARARLDPFPANEHLIPGERGRSRCHRNPPEVHTVALGTEADLTTYRQPASSANARRSAVVRTAACVPFCESERSRTRAG